MSRTNYPVKNWWSPIYYLEDAKKGRWEIKTKVMKKGMGDDMLTESLGHDWWVCTEEIEIVTLEETVLSEDYVPELDPIERKYEKKTWMSDSPGEYFGQLDLVNRILVERDNKGKIKQKNVIIGGLGLGLIVHLLRMRKDIDRIFVIEIDDDIIDLVWNFTKQACGEHHLTLIRGDFFELIKDLSQVREFQENINVIIVDIWQTNDSKGEKLFNASKKLLEARFPKAQHLFWLFQNEVENKLAKPYIRF